MEPETWNVKSIYQEILAAEKRIRPYVRKTFLEYSPYFSDRTGCSVFLKLENLQLTGSFKLRGAFSKILSLGPKQANRGVVTASTGNHGMAVAFALKTTGLRGTIYLPQGVPRTKIEALKRYGGVFRFRGSDPGDTELRARRIADREGTTYISPYNDPQIVAGQGTVGLELLEQLPEMDTVFVSVGGGGLISGVGAYLKTHRPEVRLVGCLPRHSPVMYECVGAGRIVDFPCQPTLSDGTAGAVEPGSITFPLCRQLVDEYLLVAEEEIAAAMRLMIEHHHTIIEGAAGVALASLLQKKDRFKGQNVVVILCGGNVDLEVLRRILGR